MLQKRGSYREEQNTGEGEESPLVFVPVKVTKRPKEVLSFDL